MTNEELAVPRSKVVWMTGFSGSGKSTIAMALKTRLDGFSHPARVLDGDTIRSNMANTKFGREARLAHGLYVGHMALELVTARSSAIVALISPYAEGRAQVRSLFAAGQFLEVHVSTPLEVCEERDVKGLYRRARSGEINEFTGISDPYEAPISPDIEIDTTQLSLNEAVNKILSMGFPELGV